MSKMSKVIAVLGVVAGLGVAALPLSSYAEIPSDAFTQSTTAKIELQVEGAISISTNAPASVIDLGKVMPGASTDWKAAKNDLQVKVESNSDGAQYDLYINTMGDGSMVGKTTGDKIKPLGTAGATSTWGYAYSESAFSVAADATEPTWAAVPVEPAILTGAGKLSTTGANTTSDPKVKASHVSYFKFKATAAPTLTADTYSAPVVFTAVVK